MSDWTEGKLRIGGKIKRSLIEPLYKQLRDHSPSYGDIPSAGWIEAVEGGASLGSCDGDNGLGAENCHIMVTDDQARHGHFADLEAWCVKNGISFEVDSDSGAEYDRQVIYFRPDAANWDPDATDSDGVVSVCVDIKSNPTIQGDLVSAEVQKLADYFDMEDGAAVENRPSVVTDARFALATLRSLCPPNFGNLPDVEVIDG
jgi:hypothetical protein